MKVVRHINDVVNHRANLLDGKLLQVPERRRGSDRDGLSGAQLVLKDLEELGVVGSYAFITRRDRLDIRLLQIPMLVTPDNKQDDQVGGGGGGGGGAGGGRT